MKKRSYALIQSSLIKDTLQSIFPGIETKIIFRYLLVIAAYVILTILLTYPVAFTLGTHIPGLGDAFQWMNTLWLTYFAVAHPDITSLTHNNMIFFPTGIPWMPFPSAFNQLDYTDPPSGFSNPGNLFTHLASYLCSCCPWSVCSCQISDSE